MPFDPLDYSKQMLPEIHYSKVGDKSKKVADDGEDDIDDDALAPQWVIDELGFDPREMTAYSPDEPRFRGKWTSGGDVPAQHLSYSAFKKIPGERHLDFSPHAFRQETKDPKLKYWVVFSLGSSFHDPQEMYKIASGKEVPAGVKEITTALEFRSAWRHIQEKRAIAYSYSRRSGL
jgi:hypothetical protein